ncbi:MAG: CD1247 N-terminal domain-containing protein [Syntrophomonadales bacterium]
MKKLSEKISFLQGLSEGMNVLDNGPQGKLIIEMLDVMSDMVDYIDEIRSEFEDFKIYVETIDNDLLDLEEDMYGEDDQDYIEVTCDNCGEDVYFEASCLDDEDVIEVICPKCNEVVYINDGSFDFEPSVIEGDQSVSKQTGVSPSNGQHQPM